MSFIQTKGGSHYEYGTLTLRMTIEDIAIVMSRLPRFGGHTDTDGGYSILQHSLHVSELADYDAVSAMYALTHDAHEILILDQMTPLKEALGLTDENPLWVEVESKAMRAVHMAMGIRPPTDGDIFEYKRPDIIALLTEKRDLFLPCDAEWREFKYEAQENVLLRPATAQGLRQYHVNTFVNRLNELKKKIRLRPDPDRFLIPGWKEWQGPGKSGSSAGLRAAE